MTRRNWVWAASLLAMSLLAPLAWSKPATPPTSAYRFGDWVLIVPGIHAVPEGAAVVVDLDPQQSHELRLYWQNGKDRALALRFNDFKPGLDRAVLKAYDDIQVMDACEHGAQDRLPNERTDLPLPPDISELPDDSEFRISGSHRVLRRVGDELVADLAKFRVKVATDSPLVRAGDPASGDFCRWEMEQLED
jgi:hypothetical protein